MTTLIPKFQQADTGAINRPINEKLAETVSVKDFGAVGDGVVNDRNAIQAALNTGKSVLIPSGTYLFNTSVFFTADNQCIYGLGNDSILKSATGSVYIESAGFDNLTVRDLKIDGSTGTNGGIRITGGAKNFNVLNVYFYQGGQRVWLWACNHVTVQNCTFDNTGYGVIAQNGYSSNYVLIDGNIAQNMTGDFVEANQASVNSEFWTISNNIFTGSASYPTRTTEQRFVGITEVRGVVISGNTIRNVAGDAAIHLEDALGETIVSNNVFDNCLGDQGYIYILNAAEDIVINANIFLRTNAALASEDAVSTSSGTYANSIIFTNNRIVGLSSSGNFSGLDLGFHSGKTIVANNLFKNLNVAIKNNATFNTLVNGNIFDGCDGAIINSISATNSAGRDWSVTDNLFIDTVGTYDILERQNTSGTNAPKRWNVQGNVFSKQVLMQGLGGGVVGSSSDAEDITISNNVFGTTASLSTGGRMSRLMRFNNVFRDPTAGGGTTLVQDLRDYANDAAAAAGTIPIGGLYRNGSVIQVRVT